MDGIGWAAGAMSAARLRLDVAASNLANGSTDGFRKTVVHGHVSAFGLLMQQSQSQGEGALRRTDRPFDLALVGRGAFRVRDAHGHVFETRCGAFVRDRFGRLTDASGRTLMAGRNAVVVPEGAEIREDGRIVREGREFGRIPLPSGTSVRSGFLESSNVDAIGEMIDVMTSQRSFEAAQKVLTAIDSTREKSITQVAAVKA